MAYNITLQDNYIYIDNNGGTLLDRPAKDVTITKVSLSSELYCVRLRDKTVSNFEGVHWSDFTLDGIPFITQEDFENWKNENTGSAAVRISTEDEGTLINDQDLESSSTTNILLDSILEELRITNKYLKKIYSPT